MWNWVSVYLQLVGCGTLRGGEALGVPKAASPPRAPPLWPRGTGCLPPLEAKARRKSSGTKVLHGTAKRAQRRGFLGGACGLRNSELAPPKGLPQLSARD